MVECERRVDIQSCPPALLEHESNQTEIFAMDVLDVVETLILLKTVLQEPMLVVRPWIHLTQNQILLNQTKVLATK